MVDKSKSLRPDVLDIVRDKGTEAPRTGEYDDFDRPGTYLCRQCGLSLFRSQTKFYSGCGWPSFDSEVYNHILKKIDKDGIRTEIMCVRCEAHLGHVFKGEKLTSQNIRYCVNSLSLDFVPDLFVNDTEEAIFAAGCFWGVEYYFKLFPGILKTEVGYTGGLKDNPNYQDVCSEESGHFEAIRVIYDPNKLSYEKLAQYFFEIHDPTQQNGQGPDIGSQYLSVIFYYNQMQKDIAEHLIKVLEGNNYSISTDVLPVSTFWKAEGYHQDYYTKNNKHPYCHAYKKLFK
jgi:peptide methionine sulfoxide reductase msrA/msrB